MHRMRRVRPTRGRASAGPPNDPRSPDRRRGRHHRRETATPEPVNGRWNLQGRAGKTERVERGLRIQYRTALHAHVAEPRRRYVRRHADRLTCSRVVVGERRAGERTKGQTRCRSHREDSLPHRLAPSVGHLHSSSVSHRGAFHNPAPPHGQASRRLSTRLATSCTARRRTPRGPFSGHSSGNHTRCRSPLVDESRACSPFRARLSLRRTAGSAEPSSD